MRQYNCIIVQPFSILMNFYREFVYDIRFANFLTILYWACYEVSHHENQVRNWLINQGSSQLFYITNNYKLAFLKISLFSIDISCLKIIVVADTRSLIIDDIKELHIRNLYREEKNYKQQIQMFCFSRYKCSRYSDAFPFVRQKLYVCMWLSMMLLIWRKSRILWFNFHLEINAVSF